jgi:pimeloyl-ACP methyl ester carboxylesterase
VPESGYGPAALAGDVIAFVQGLELERVLLVGYSIAGYEMTVLASDYPKRLAGLDCLYAAYDVVAPSSVFDRIPLRAYLRLSGREL